MIVARDIAHAKLQERIDSAEGLPQYFKNLCVYYAGPAKTPEGYAPAHLVPQRAGRMDSYVDSFQSEGGSMVMLAKGNRSPTSDRSVAKNTAVFTSAPSADPPLASPKTPYGKVECH